MSGANEHDFACSNLSLAGKEHLLSFIAFKKSRVAFIIETFLEMKCSTS